MKMLETIVVILMIIVFFGADIAEALRDIYDILRGK